MPECSCSACVKRLIEEHVPASLTSAPAAATPAAAELSASVPRVDLSATPIAAAPGPRGMLRRLRRSRLRRTA